MLAGDIITNYTDHQYLSKSELVMALGTSLIDPFWIKIEEYRRNNAIFLDLASISRIPFSLTLTPSISKKIGDVSNEKLEQLRLEFQSLDFHQNLKAQVIREFSFPSLKAINDVERLGLSDVAIKAVISGNNNGNNPNEKILSRYLQCFDYIKEHQDDEINEDFLASLWGLMLGESELTEFYRNVDSVNKYSQIQVNRDDFEAPSKEIETLMDNLFNFIAGESCNNFQKSLAVLYFVFYVKPFSRHNEAIATLFAKTILLKEGYSDAILYLPLESILRPNFPKFKPTFLNVQRYNDLTYFILNSLEYIDHSIDGMIATINQGKSKMMDDEREVATPSDLGLEKKEVQLEKEEVPLSKEVEKEVNSSEDLPIFDEEETKAAYEEKEESLNDLSEFFSDDPKPAEKKQEETPKAQENLKPAQTESILEPQWESSTATSFYNVSYILPTEIFQSEEKKPQVEPQPKIVPESKPIEQPQPKIVPESKPIEQPQPKIVPESNPIEQPQPKKPQEQEKVFPKANYEEPLQPVAKHEEENRFAEKQKGNNVPLEPIKQPKIEQPKQKILILDELPPQKEGPERVAYNKAEHIYSDKEMREYAKYLLETHPNLKRHQAYFYSCHATIGRYYTIQDFKRYAKCVYETARTSMENLVKEGLYQKIQVKNKFVYTPFEGEKK